MLILLVSSASGFMCLNFDGSTEGNLGLVGVGGLLLDSAGSSILPFSSPLGLCSVNREGMEALRTGPCQPFI